jgi:hypothetical protein
VTAHHGTKTHHKIRRKAKHHSKRRRRVVHHKAHKKVKKVELKKADDKKAPATK